MMSETFFPQTHMIGLHSGKVGPNRAIKVNCTIIARM